MALARRTAKTVYHGRWWNCGTRDTRQMLKSWIPDSWPRLINNAARILRGKSFGLRRVKRRARRGRGGGGDRKWKREKLMDEGVGGASNSIRDTLETNFHSKVCSAFNEKKDRSGFRLG